MAIDIDINVHDDKATQTIKNFNSTVERESKKSSAAFESSFRRASEGIIDSTNIMNNRVTGILGGIGGKAGVAALAVTAVATAMTSLANRAAKAGESIEAIKFEATLESIEKRTDSILDSIGNKLLPFYNRMFEFYGIAASTAEVTEKQGQKQTERQTALRNLQMDIAGLQIDIANTLNAAEEKRNNFIQKRIVILEKEKQLVQQTKLEILQEKIGSFSRTENFLQPQIQSAKEIGQKIQEMNDRLNDSEAAEARAEFLEEVEKGSKKASFEVDRLADSMAQLAQAIASTARSGGGFFDILPSLINIAFSYFSKGGFPLQFANGGIVAAQNGLIVKRPTLFMAGENFKPEAIVPLAAEKSSQRSAVMQAAGLSERGNITVMNNFNVPAIDPVTIRNLLLPEINRQIRRGEKLLASELR